MMSNHDRHLLLSFHLHHLFPLLFFRAFFFQQLFPITPPASALNSMPLLFFIYYICIAMHIVLIIWNLLPTLWNMWAPKYILQYLHIVVSCYVILCPYPTLCATDFVQTFIDGQTRSIMGGFNTTKWSSGLFSADNSEQEKHNGQNVIDEKLGLTCG